MSLKHLTWTGAAYLLAIRRHWNHFFDLVPVCEIRAPKIEIVLPLGAGYHTMEVREKIECARESFDKFDNFWRFSCEACDQYCNFFVMKRPMQGNQFAEAEYSVDIVNAAILRIVKSSRGYMGKSM